MYNIGYINANSLPDRKFSQAVSLLDKTFDFLFISEHWYQNHQSRLAHPSVLVSTQLKNYPNLQQRRSRPGGGIYLLAKRELHHSIIQLSTTSHSITVQLSDLTFAAVYYPPKSINLTDIEHDLDSIGSVDILLGDINTRLSEHYRHNSYNSGQSANSIRRKLFTNWASKKNMSHIGDSAHPWAKSYANIPDHVFAHTSKLSTVRLKHIPTRDLSFITDHRYLLHVCFQPPHPSTSSKNLQPDSSSVQSTPLRFHIQKLQNPETLNKFQNTWRKVFNIHRGYTHSEQFSIDMLDHILISQLQAAAETVLGIYKPNTTKRKDDIVIGHLRERHDLNASIQLLKRASRSMAQSAPITSGSRTLTPLEECSNHYSKLFNRGSNHSPSDEYQTRFTESSIGIFALAP